jgi:hypothetical protein
MKKSGKIYVIGKEKLYIEENMLTDLGLKSFLKR